MDLNLAGKVAVVTGAAKGIGAATAAGVHRGRGQRTATGCRRVRRVPRGATGAAPNSSNAMWPLLSK